MVSANSKIKLELPRGVSIREHGSDKKSIQIAFSYNGRQCRESLRHIAVNASGIEEAKRLLGRINTAIEDGTFDYGKAFPKSKAASRLEGVGSVIWNNVVRYWPRPHSRPIVPWRKCAFILV
jgi:hypothetical protein